MNRLLFKLKRRLRALFRRAELERELDAEVRFHLEKDIEQNIAQGHKFSDKHGAVLALVAPSS